MMTQEIKNLKQIKVVLICMISFNLIVAAILSGMDIADQEISITTILLVFSFILISFLYHQLIKLVNQAIQRNMNTIRLHKAMNMISDKNLPGVLLVIRAVSTPEIITVYVNDGFTEEVEEEIKSICEQHEVGYITEIGW